MSDKVLAQLRSAIDRAAQLYYTVGAEQSGVTDDEYDMLIDELRRLCPDDPRLTRVGAPFSVAELRNKAEHTIPMGSLDNTEGGIDGFGKWYRWLVEQCDGGVPSIHLSLKMDGSSVAAYYEDGQLQRVIGRGNGEVGEDLTANAVKWRHLPTFLPKGFTGAVRGEAMLYNEDFAKVNEENGTLPEEISNPRNVGNGILGRSDGKQSEYIQFIAFNIVGDKIDSLAKKMEALRAIGFKPVEFEVIHACGLLVDEVIAAVEASFAKTYEGRDSLPFGIDGVVACADEIALHGMLTRDRKDALRPRYAKAVKFATLKNETTVKGVTITVGHTGAIIPTADLEPVRVGGVTVDSALLNNWNVSSDNPTAAHVKIGDTVEVELAGDIIPKICQVLVTPEDAKPIEEPKTCPACESPTTRTHRGKDGAVTYCSKPESCSAAAVYRIKHYIGTSKKGLGILGIGDSVLNAMIDAELVKSPADLYRLTIEQIENLEVGTSQSGSSIRLGHSRAVGIVAEIEKAKQVPLTKFLGALGVDLLGRRRVEILAEECGLHKLDDWMDAAKLATIPGDTTREAIISGLQRVRSVIAELKLVGVDVNDYKTKPVARSASAPVEAKVEDDGEIELHVEVGSFEAPSGDPIAGRTFCFTGTRAHLDEVEARGGIIKSGVSKALDFLVQKDPTSHSNKTQKAESYGVKIIGIATLELILKGERDLP